MDFRGHDAKIITSQERGEIDLMIEWMWNAVGRQFSYTFKR